VSKFEIMYSRIRDERPSKKTVSAAFLAR